MIAAANCKYRNRRKLKKNKSFQKRLKKFSNHSKNAEFCEKLNLCFHSP